MYLKERNIGKAESEEVVPVKTETEIISQAGSADRSPGSSFLAPISCGAGCRVRSAYGRPTPGIASPPLALLTFQQPRE